MNIQQPQSFNVLVIGEKCDDIFVYGNTTRISPEAPVPIFETETKKIVPGMAANVAKNLDGLTVNAILLSNKEKIRKKRFVDSRYNQHVLRVDTNNSVKCFNLSRLDKIDVKIDAIIISDYDKGFIPQELIKDLLEKLSKFNVKIFVDSKKKDLSKFENCILKVNEKEFNEAKNTLPVNSEIIQTLGSKGAIYNNKNYPVKKVETFDVVGAGDTFISGLVYKYLQTSDLEQSIMFANICASFVVTKIGTYAIKLSDIENEICF